MENTLLEENRVLQRALAERDEKIAERDEVIAARTAEITALEQQVARIAALEQRVASIADLERQIAALARELRSAARDRATLEARLQSLLARRRALATFDAPGQQDLFADQAPLPTPPCANEAPDGETGADKLRPRHVRTNAPRKIAYEALPREHVQHELPESERTCRVTGKPLVVIDEKTSEELEYRPAKLVVLVHHRKVYGLCEADRAQWKVEPIAASLPPRPIENCLAGPGLMAWILVQKYCNHLPLYRQQVIFEREGLALPRQSMCDWVLGSAFNLSPIQRALKKRILTSGVVQLDDTPIECQGGKGQRNFKAHLWTYTSPLSSGVVFDFTPDWEHHHVAAFLGKGVTGYLVGDGYAGYGVLVKENPGLIEAGCWAHVLRKFRDALKESPVEALRMMHHIGKLFDVESAAREAGLAAEAVHALRQEKCTTVLAEIQAESEALRGSTSDQGPLAKALTYLKNQWPTLKRFMEDGRVPIHNNSCENAIRPVAVGRRNWLFAGSERGGDAAATIYSLVESCRRVGVDPFVYLRDVLVRVCTHPASRIDELVPENWKVLFAAQATA